MTALFLLLVVVHCVLLLLTSNTQMSVKPQMSKSGLLIRKLNIDTLVEVLAKKVREMQPLTAKKKEKKQE